MSESSSSDYSDIESDSETDSTDDDSEKGKLQSKHLPIFVFKLTNYELLQI